MMSSNPLVFWLIEIPLLAILLYAVLRIVDAVVTTGTGKSKLWFRQDICDDFQYPLECKVCSRGDCVDCPVLEKEE